MFTKIAFFAVLFSVCTLGCKTVPVELQREKLSEEEVIFAILADHHFSYKSRLNVNISIVGRTISPELLDYLHRGRPKFRVSEDYDSIREYLFWLDGIQEFAHDYVYARVQTHLVFRDTSYHFILKKTGDGYVVVDVYEFYNDFFQQLNLEWYMKTKGLEQDSTENSDKTLHEP